MKDMKEQDNPKIMTNDKDDSKRFQKRAIFRLLSYSISTIPTMVLCYLLVGQGR